MKLLILFTIFTLSSCTSNHTRHPNPEAAAADESFVPNQLLVALKKDLSVEERKKLFEEYKVVEKEKVGSSPLYLVLTQPQSADIKVVMTEMQKNAQIKFVEKNQIIKVPTPIKEEE